MDALADSPIGVFDSGVGGLTVLDECLARLPAEDFLYFGDTAWFPYGDKSPEQLRGRSEAIARWLLGRGAKLIVVMRQESHSNHSIGRFRLNISGHDPKLLSLKTDPTAEAARRLLAKPTDQLTKADSKALEKLFTDSPEHPRFAATAKVAAAKTAFETANTAPVTVMVMKELPKPRDAFVLLRGEYDKIETLAGRFARYRIMQAEHDTRHRYLSIDHLRIRPHRERVAPKNAIYI
jgi:hypothetical protein